ncbi:hypothetical protein VSH64_34315 [Amycolatopsis rhabdoformis]|uniref:DUF5666 domain-containing protein n=1 Tax=Amycolatopsis rhabdoformis TaxID=1448059 RepID=A0ABZ1I179_9PSEU|nr:hypothetical protein [Amycolatopsis rhabdoformis]WSE27894.1 hypothetical protein VSH64_34315 [Amycolatopsis rhabdoformis]
MTTDPAQGATWGAPGGEPPATPKKSWSGRKTAIAAGVAVVIAVGGGLAIWAGTSSNDASAQQSPGGFRGPGGTGGPGGFGQGGPGGQRGAFGGAAALRDALHGDFVVTDPTGGYTTERLQTGAITEISATSVTLTSKDGYKQTYVLTSSTQQSSTAPKTGDNVTVLAKLSGTTATATSLEPVTTATGRGGQPGANGQPGQGRRRYGNN